MKEALDKLYKAVDEELLYEQCGVIFATELIEVIEKEFEQLEKENQELKDDNSQMQGWYELHHPFSARRY